MAPAQPVAGGPRAKQDDRFSKKLRDIERKQKNPASQAMKPSVEGRGIVVMHTQ